MKDDRLDNVNIVRLRDGKRADVGDVVLKERPLTLKVNDDPFITTMCTPGDEIELAAGLMFAEGVIDSKGDLATIRFCTQEEDDVVEIKLAEERIGVARARIEAARGIRRSSCGICGKKLIDDIAAFTKPVDAKIQVDAQRLIELEATINNDYQKLFKQTGAAHSAALLDERGAVISFAEDVGRHNALDKAIGRLILKGKTRVPEESRPRRDVSKGAGVVTAPSIAILSSRASFEMVQKVARAGIPIACFASAVTDMAVELADKLGVTLVGFLRPTGLNIYTHPQRININM